MKARTAWTTPLAWAALGALWAAMPSTALAADRVVLGEEFSATW